MSGPTTLLVILVGFGTAFGIFAACSVWSELDDEDRWWVAVITVLAFAFAGVVVWGIIGALSFISTLWGAGW